MNNLIELDNKAKEYIENNNLDISKPKEILDFAVSDIQNNIFKSELSDAIKDGINAGIRIIFPDFIEEEIVNLNNNIYDYGIKEGINKSIDGIIEKAKPIIMNFSKGFENIVQVQNEISNSNSMDEIIDLLNKGINKLKNEKTVDDVTLETIEAEKSILTEKIDEKIDNKILNQVKNTRKLEKYISNWKKSFEEKDFLGMEKEYNKIKKIENSVMMTENIFKEYNKITNIQKLIKNNGKNFNLSQEEIELLNKLK